MTTFTVPGRPQGKGRPRFSGGRVHTPKKTADYERRVAMEAIAGGVRMIDGAVSLMIVATFRAPTRLPRRVRQEMEDCGAPHTGHLDCDNIAKAIADALNGVAYRDDAQVALLSVVKIHGPEPGVSVSVGPLILTSGGGVG